MFKEKNIIFLVNNLILLIPLFLITGPFLPDLVVVIVDFIYLFFFFNKRDKSEEFIKNPIFIIFFSFWLISIFSSLVSSDLIFSVKTSLVYVRFVVFILAINFFFKNQNKNLKNLFFILLLLYSILFIDALFQFINEKNLIGFKVYNPDKINSFFGKEAILGSYIARLSPLLIALYFYLYKKINNFYESLFSLFLILMFVLTIIAGSRSSIFMYLIVLFFTFIIAKNLRKYFLIYGFGLSLLLVFLFFYNEKFNYKIYNSLLDPIRTIFHIKPVNDKFIFKENLNINIIQGDKKKISIFTKEHQTHYETAYKMFLDKKFIGIGPKMFRIKCIDEKYYINSFSCTTHPHNFYMQFLAETGLAGFILMSSIFFITFFLLFKGVILIFTNIKRENQNIPKLFIILSIFINLWPLMPSGNFYNNWLSTIMIYPIGFYFILQKK